MLRFNLRSIQRAALVVLFLPQPQWDSAMHEAQPPAASSRLGSPTLASHPNQKAAHDLHGARRYMDLNALLEAQNILEEDDDKRGQTRLA